MDMTAVITGIVGALSTLVLGLVSKRFDYKKEQRKAAMEEAQKKSDNDIDKIRKAGDEWEHLYKDQLKTNKDLQKVCDDLRLEMFSLQREVNNTNKRINDFVEKEQGYQLQIEQLREENDDLREANEILQEKLKGSE